MEKEVLRKLKRYVKYNGYAHLACWLNHRDCQSVKKWIYNNKIPNKRILEVKEFLDILKEM